MDALKRTGRRLGCPVGKKSFATAAACGLCCCTGWLLMLSMPRGWHRLDTFIWDFHISLYSFHVDPNPLAKQEEQRHPDNPLFSIFDHVEEGQVLWLQEARWKVCQKGVSYEWCVFFTWLQIASWLVAWTIMFEVCCKVLGMAAAFNYFYIKPRNEYRRWAKIYLSVGPTTVTCVLICYVCMTSNMAKLAGGTDKSTLGMVFYASCLLALLSFIPVLILIIFGFAAPAVQEPLAAPVSDQENGGYGAATFEDTTGAGVGFGKAQSDSSGSTGPPMRRISGPIESY